MFWRPVAHTNSQQLFTVKLERFDDTTETYGEVRALAFPLSEGDEIEQILSIGKAKVMIIDTCGALCHDYHLRRLLVDGNTTLSDNTIQELPKTLNKQWLIDHGFETSTFEQCGDLHS